MLNTTYICNRCGKKSNFAMRNLVIQFGKGWESACSPLPEIETGDLCIECEVKFSEIFFNQIKTFLKGE